MRNDRKPNNPEKKGLPGGFILVLVAMVLIILTIQSLSTDKATNVSFSHQLEHLVNLDLLHPDHNRSIAQNDNLVTFSGKFRENLTPEGSDRYRYLELLDQNHQLASEKQTLTQEFDEKQKEVIAAGDWFLQITGITVPKSGFSIVGSIYDLPQRANSIVIKSEPKALPINLKSLTATYDQIKAAPTSANANEMERNLSTLLQYFRSPKLGIGAEPYKQNLKEMQQELDKAQTEGSLAAKVAIYGQVIGSLNNLKNNLLEEKNHIALAPLRSVRRYVDTLKQYQVVQKDLEKNESLLDKARQKVAHVVWYFNDKELSSRSLEKQEPEAFNQWFAQAKQEWGSFAANKGLSFKSPDQPRNTVLKKTFKSQEPSPNYFSYILTLLPIAIVCAILYFFFSRQMKGSGSSAMNFGKSPARMLTKESNKFTFKDVAGAVEAKEELEEIIDFLKDPQKFTSLGAKIPKGVLLVGPPGTGKTLIAKAVAGEADRPFFSISGSDFVEMFVGVGASRVRDLFEQAKKNSPCIIFMDEIDAVGRHRGAGIGGGHDEREQTLNQLLVEMDGFDTKEGVILMAATNRPDILDKALLRPGRFDRRVMLDLPDVKGRFEILKVHARKIKIDPSVQLMDIAKNTPGASGADLESILNEAALLAARKGRSAVTSVEAIEACDKVRFGKERRSLEMDEKEKNLTAIHESGHAIVALKVEHADPVDKVTIIPRGFSLGATHFMPKKNRLSYWKKEIIDQLAICMGGRVAEEVFIHDMSSGAQQDINQATKLARAMVCEWGMSEDLGLITYDEKSDNGQYLGMNNYHDKSYSEETARKIDHEVHLFIEEAYKRAKTIVEAEKEKVQLMADMLREFETLDAQDVQDIYDGKWDIEGKRKRLQEADDLQKKTPPPLPPSIEDDKGGSQTGDALPQQT